ncbi:MAG: putative pyridoxal-dependent aspartate 1-decarboxylase [Thermodesulfobacteriota bacterium]|nr:putative pyridoxal-dependent aspartate 1-decarboxylase [Thermodesulfobacteriota bacterium]
MTETALANLQNLYRIFTVPEAPDSTLGAVDHAISENVADFLQKHIVALERSLEDIENDFAAAKIPEEPSFVSTYTEFVKQKLVAQSVHTAAPGFVGHMTSALPYFMLPLSRIMTALNQNLVKVETSKAFTPMERQVLAMLHHLIYRQDDSFYEQWIHDSQHALGAFCSGGTIANSTALWVARNQLCRPEGAFSGIAREGLFKALNHLNCNGLAILVSRRAHYSLGKAVDLLGVGRDNLILVDTDADSRIDMQCLKAEYSKLCDQNIRPLALIGIAGTTETGHIDPLEELADFAAEVNCHFHVDAAWGGPTLFSKTHSPLLKGIERADSVTIDAHKQLYVPMGAGMVLFKDPHALTAIEHHANYILRHGSKDLGSHTLEGSRPGMAMLVHAGLSIIGRKGYELLIDLGIEKAQKFADLIKMHPNFELITAPELNILTYRYNPVWLQEKMVQLDQTQLQQINQRLDLITQEVQKRQREAGKTFVSRTRLRSSHYQSEQISVFRSVLANPLTTEDILAAVLDEQCAIVKQTEVQDFIGEIKQIIA